MAVYTHITRAQLEDFLASYDLGDLQDFSGIHEGVENSNYLLETTRGQFILTLFEQRVQANEVPFFMALTEHLAQRGIHCPLPIRRRDGSVISSLAERPTVIITFLQGKSVMQPETQHCAAAGRLLADLHQAVTDFPQRRPNTVGGPVWTRLLSAGDDNPAIMAIREECAQILQQWPSGLPAGVIHADLFPNNVFFKDGRLCGVIDFYFACYDFLAYDLAICINSWCTKADGDIDTEKARALTQAYVSRRALTREERAALPLLLRGAAIRFLATRHYDWINQPPGALVTPKDPAEYARILTWHNAHPQACGEWLT